MGLPRDDDFDPDNGTGCFRDAWSEKRDAAMHGTDAELDEYYMSLVRPKEPGASDSSNEGNGTVFALIAYSQSFQNLTLMVIVLNAVWIGVDVQANNPKIKEDKGSDKLPLEPYSTVIENLFCSYFSLELLFRFLGFRYKTDCLRDRWFLFDGLLVLFMVIETWILVIVAAVTGGGAGGALSKFSALRLLRLLRLTRMARLMKQIPELLTLVKGIVAAIKVTAWTLLFILLVMYVCAIVFTAQIGDPDAPENKYADPYWVSDSDPTANELFGSMGDSMMTLFTRGVLGDNLAETLQAIKDRGGTATCDPMVNGTQPICEREGGSLFLFWVFVIFMILSAFCLLNMLIGVLCQVVESTASEEDANNQLNDLRHQMAEAFKAFDTSQDGVITEVEWAKMKDHKKVRTSMAQLGVEEIHMDERLNQIQESLFGMLTEEFRGAHGPDEVVPMGGSPARNGLTFAQFMRQVLKVRPDIDASALDIEILNRRVQDEERIFNERLDRIEETLKKGVRASPPPPASTPPRIGRPPPRQDVEVSSQQQKQDPSWLRTIPTEALFATLRSRAPPELGQPRLLVETLS